MNHFIRNRSFRSVFSLNRAVWKWVFPSSISRGFSDLSDSWKSTAGLVRCPANDVPLSPITFLERTAKVYRDTTSVVYGSVSFTWEETYNRCLRLASAMTQLGISPGQVVATLAPNIPAMYELHFATPMAGAVLCTLNTRHDSSMLAVLLRHSEAKIIFVDTQLFEVANEAIQLLGQADSQPPKLVLIHDSEYASSPTSFSSNAYEYETLIASGSCEFEARNPRSEWDPISINYTSGTTSMPKGVVYSHRGAYLNSLATVLLAGMGSMPVYLWTCPMFHCNGWCLTWGVAAQGGTNICLRKVSPKAIFEQIALHKVTHLAAAPTVLNMIVNSPECDRRPLPNTVVVLTGGSPPPPQVFTKVEQMGFQICHLYGLTETYGPGTYCTWKPMWDCLPCDERSKIRVRQGVRHVGLHDVDVIDPKTMVGVPADGKTVGEIMFRGNTVMSGYLKNKKATEEAFKGGWFHSGDAGVKHPDHYIEVKDRLKDVIISGGENISSVEVETVLFGHPAVVEAAVVGRPDDHWGETPCAFVALKEGSNVTAQQLIEYCRHRLPHYMAPRSIVFQDLPKTSTGKVQKFILRDRAKAMGSLS
ncbi:putative acyl-activating enzyme 2 [Cucurbita argyrosperma subsp. argyrosperma]|nr:putative acyl-activating enzyme 2 [Cucurbita argyrosperma subsp. argyrosperma]